MLIAQWRAVLNPFDIQLVRNVIFYAAWAVFLYVGYYAVGAMKPEEISYDPFEILGISTVRRDLLSIASCADATLCDCERDVKVS